MTATRIEFHAVARAFQDPQHVSLNKYRTLTYKSQNLHVLLIQSGIGPEKARACVRQLFEIQSWDLLISSGFAGALDDTTSVGSILIGQEVVANSSSPGLASTLPIMCDPDWVKTVLTIPWKGNEALQTGKFSCADRVLTRAEEKHALRVCSEAAAVDMESETIGLMAQEHDVPFLIVRAISDGVADNLPVDFNLFLAPSSWLVGVMRIVSTPKSWKGFWNLYRHSKQASQQLTVFFEAFFPEVSTMPQPASALLDES